MKEMMEEVAREERMFHDVFGCRDCYIDPHSGHVSYCPLSVYNPFHPSHICLGGVPCTCDSYLADCDCAQASSLNENGKATGEDIIV